MYLYQITVRCLMCVHDVNMCITMTTTCDDAHKGPVNMMIVILNSDIHISQDHQCYWLLSHMYDGFDV